MKYAVLYQSKTGNTKQLAERIFRDVKSEDKELIDIDVSSDIPEADVYFIGFGVHRSFCSMEILGVFEKIDHGAVALFATCGFMPIGQYKYMIERKLTLWLSNDVKYLGMFLCQGKVEDYRKKILLDENAKYRQELAHMFEIGNDHPNSDDLRNVSDFLKTTLAKISS